MEFRLAQYGAPVIVCEFAEYVTADWRRRSTLGSMLLEPFRSRSLRSSF
jgi:hypothetical protein